MDETEIVKQRMLKALTDKSKKGENFVIDPDQIMENYPSFSYETMEEFIKPRNNITDELFKTAINNPNYEKVIFTAGGAGSGKSEAIVDILKYGKDRAIVMDGTFSNTGAIGKLEKALKAGKEVEVQAVYTDLESAIEFNMKRSRVVPEEVLIRTHKDFRANLLKLAEKHPNLKISIQKNGVGYPEKGVPVELASQEILLDFLRNNLIK